MIPIKDDISLKILRRLRIKRYENFSKFLSNVRLRFTVPKTEIFEITKFLRFQFYFKVSCIES